MRIRSMKVQKKESEGESKLKWVQQKLKSTEMYLNIARNAAGTLNGWLNIDYVSHCVL